MERQRQVCTAFKDEELRAKAFILKEQIGQISDFVWPELNRKTKWNMNNSIGLDRYSWDIEDENDEDGTETIAEKIDWMVRRDIQSGVFDFSKNS